MKLIAMFHRHNIFTVLDSLYQQSLFSLVCDMTLLLYVLFLSVYHQITKDVSDQDGRVIENNKFYPTSASFQDNLISASSWHPKSEGVLRALFSFPVVQLGFSFVLHLLHLIKF
jgi:hypothetical protein